MASEKQRLRIRLAAKDFTSPPCLLTSLLSSSTVLLQSSSCSLPRPDQEAEVVVDRIHSTQRPRWSGQTDAEFESSGAEIKRKIEGLKRLNSHPAHKLRPE